MHAQISKGGFPRFRWKMNDDWVGFLQKAKTGREERKPTVGKVW